MTNLESRLGKLERNHPGGFGRQTVVVVDAYQTVEEALAEKGLPPAAVERDHVQLICLAYGPCYDGHTDAWFMKVRGGREPVDPSRLPDGFKEHAIQEWHEANSRRTGQAS